MFRDVVSSATTLRFDWVNHRIHLLKKMFLPEDDIAFRFARVF